MSFILHPPTSNRFCFKFQKLSLIRDRRKCLKDFPIQIPDLSPILVIDPIASGSGFWIIVSILKIPHSGVLECLRRLFYINQSRSRFPFGGRLPAEWKPLIRTGHLDRKNIAIGRKKLKKDRFHGYFTQKRDFVRRKWIIAYLLRKRKQIRNGRCG